MKQKEMFEEIEAMLNVLIKRPIGTKGFVFSINETPLNFMKVTAPKPKTTVWYSMNPSDIVYTYKTLCEQFKLPYDSTLQGQYIYIIDLAWD